MRLSHRPKPIGAARFTGLLTDELCDPVVLLHGFGASAIGWLPVATAVSKTLDILAPDMPGHGGAQTDLAEPSLDALAQYVECGLEDMDLSDVHLTGHSLGGAVAVAIVARGRVRVQSLTLISPAGCGPELDRDFFQSFMAAQSMEAMTMVLRRAVGPRFTVTAPMARSAMNAVRTHAEPLARLVSIIGSPALRAPTEALAGFKGPLRVVWGADDCVSPPENALSLTSFAAVDYLAGVGHLPHIEQPRTVARILMERGR